MDALAKQYVDSFDDRAYPNLAKHFDDICGEYVSIHSEA